jgi:hypothetical protein
MWDGPREPSLEERLDYSAFLSGLGGWILWCVNPTADLLQMGKPAGFGHHETRAVLEKYGADERIRTADLRITNALLYQLSYIGSRSGVS